MNYELLIKIVFSLIIAMIIMFISMIKQKDNIINCYIEYGRPEKASNNEESILQVIMVTKAVFIDGKDCDVVYGVLGNEFVYIRNVDKDILDKLIYGKFYGCYVFKENDIIKHIELKGDI